jgi:hypothetical protein
MLLPHKELLANEADGKPSADDCEAARRVRAALETEDNLNAVDALGRTALHLACVHGHLGSVELLLERSADMETADEYGQTPLKIACQGGYVDVVRLLIEHGADMEKADDLGQQTLLLILACYGGHVDVMRLLIDEQGADVETADKYGQTALFHACSNSHVDVIKLLLRRATCTAITEKIEADQAEETGFSAEVCTLLAQWKGLTDRQKEIVQDHGLDCINVPGVWILAIEHEDDEFEFPVAFRLRMRWIVMVLLENLDPDMAKVVFTTAINARVR